MAIDAEKVLKRVRGTEPDRGRISLYFDKQLWKDFQNQCEGLAASRVIEELVREFIDSKSRPLTTDLIDNESSTEILPSEIPKLLSKLSARQREKLFEEWQVLLRAMISLKNDADDESEEDVG